MRSKRVWSVVGVVLGVALIVCVAWIVGSDQDRSSPAAPVPHIATEWDFDQRPAEILPPATVKPVIPGEVVQTPAETPEVPPETGKPPAFTFSGRVIDHLAVPLEGSTVVFWPNAVTATACGIEAILSLDHEAIDALPRVLTGRDGRFTIEGRHVSGPDVTGLFEDPHLVVMKEGFAIRTHVCSVYSGGPYDAGDLVLEPGGWVTGRVVDRLGRPVVGALVRVGSPTSQSMKGIVSHDESFDLLTGVFATTVSRDDGRFDTGGLWQGTVQLAIDADGFTARSLDERLEVTAGRATEVGDVVLDASVALSGLVRDTLGAPVAQARVVALSSEHPAVGRGLNEPDPVVILLHDARKEEGTRTDEHGRFVIGSLDRVNHSLLVDAPGFEPVRLDNLIPGGIEVGVTLVPEATIELLVTSAMTGQPVAGAQAEALRRPGPKKNSWLKSIQLPTQPGPGPGIVVVSRAGVARTQVTVTAPGHASQIVDFNGVAPPERLTRTVALAREAVLAGRVLTAEGAVISGAEVVLNPQSSWTASKRVVQPNEEGHYSLGGLAAGEWKLVADAPERAPVVRVERVAEGESRTGVDLLLPLSAAIFGTCYDEDGKPAAGSPRTFHRIEQDQLPLLTRDVRTDSAGRYELSDLPPGQWRVPGNPPLAFTLEAGERLQLDLLADPVAVLSGRVLFPDGSPASGAWIFASEVRSGPGMPDLIRAEADGSWLWKPALTGRSLNLTAALPGGGGTTATLNLELQRSERRTVDLILGAGRVTGRVMDSEGAPVPAAIVRLRPLDEEGRELTWAGFTSGPESFESGVVTDVEGRFEARHLAPGRYRAEVSVKGFSFEEQAPVVLDGRTPVELLLAAVRSSRVHGRVELASGVPARERTLLRAESAGRQADTLIEAGRYELTGLMPGTWRLFVTERGRVLGERTVVLVAGQELEVDLVLMP